MPLSPEEYLELRKLLNDPNVKLSDEERTAAILLDQEYDNQSAASWGSAQPPAPAQAQAPQDDLAYFLNPQLPPLPQALATQPGNTHPGGDAAAQAEWQRDPQGAVKGDVFVYEPPLRKVQERLLGDPAFARALYPDHPPDPQVIAKLTPQSSEYQAAADLWWREAADAATGAGKRAYRYSQTPWLQGENGASLSQLKTKLGGAVIPGSEAVTAFVLGVDDVGLFGAGRKAAETANPEMDRGNPLPNTEAAGGGSEGNARERFAGMVEQHPDAHLLGKALGALAPWSPANRLFSAVAGGGQKLATKLAVSMGAKAAPGLLKTAAAGVAGGVAGAADQTIREGVNAAGNLAQTGGASTGTTLDDAGDRILSVGQDAAMWGGGIGALASGAEALGNWVRTGKRYGELPGRFEQSGGRFEVGRGPVLPEQTAAQEAAARAEDLQTLDVAAKELAPELAAAEKANVAAINQKVAERKAPFLRSSEGQQRLQPKNLFQRQFQLLTENTAEVNGELRPIENKVSQVQFARDRFNDTIADVSLEPVEGAVEMTRQQANAFLAEHQKRKLMDRFAMPKAKRPPTTGAREIAPEALERGGEVQDAASSFEELLASRKVDKVYAVPRRYNAEEHEQAIKSYQKLDDPADPNARERKDLWIAGLKDRDARPMNGVPGGWSKFQQENEAMIAAGKDDRSLVAPQGDAFQSVVTYGQPQPGELPLVEALRRSAGRAGVREQLDRARGITRADELFNQLSRGMISGTFGSGTRAMGTSRSTLVDNAILRLLYPASNLLANPAARGGAGGILGTIGASDNQEREKSP